MTTKPTNTCLTEEQLKIRDYLEQFNQRNREKRLPTAEQLLKEVNKGI